MRKEGRKFRNRFRPDKRTNLKDLSPKFNCPVNGNRPAPRRRAVVASGVSQSSSLKKVNLRCLERCCWFEATQETVLRSSYIIKRITIEHSLRESLRTPIFYAKVKLDIKIPERKQLDLIPDSGYPSSKEPVRNRYSNFILHYHYRRSWERPAPGALGRLSD